MNIKVIGNGFIASHLPYERIEDRIWNANDACEAILGEETDVVVNCIGRCGNPNVDQCESIKEETNFANTILPIMLANICAENDIRFVHVGSGCIFSGESPHTRVDWGMRQQGEWKPPSRTDLGFRETDLANPQSYYAKTKYAADLAIADLPNTAILRIRMPISHQRSPRNFISKVANYKRVIDIPNSMTFLNDFVRCVEWVIQNDKRGIWNVVNPEPLSAADVMREYQKHKPGHKFDVMSGEELDSITTAKRSNCILDGSKLRDAGFEMIPSKKALEETMVRYFKESE
jgi:3,5-epimerase/4-reductase